MHPSNLLQWYQLHKRNLPWRHTRDPYIIWLSEVILQQTRVDQGLKYFEKFVELYPTVSDLAQASEKEVLTHWQGLGYYSRGRNLLQTAQTVMKDFEGKFPCTYSQLISLKGIGPYTAAAIASFSTNEKVAVLDGNVFRVLSRFFAEPEPINSTLGIKKFKKLASDFLDPTFPAEHNQAMMELGALICKPSNPSCTDCPLKGECLGFKQNNAMEFPVKLKKVKVRKRYFNYLYFTYHDQILIMERGAGDIWQGLYDLPLIEGVDDLEELQVMVAASESKLFETMNWNRVLLQYKAEHILTHQKINATFWKIELNEKFAVNEPMKWIRLDQLSEFPISRLFDKFKQHINLVGSNEKNESQ